MKKLIINGIIEDWKYIEKIINIIIYKNIME